MQLKLAYTRADSVYSDIKMFDEMMIDVMESGRKAQLAFGRYNFEENGTYLISPPAEAEKFYSSNGSEIHRAWYDVDSAARQIRGAYATAHDYL